MPPYCFILENSFRTGGLRLAYQEHQLSVHTNRSRDTQSAHPDTRTQGPHQNMGGHNSPPETGHINLMGTREEVHEDTHPTRIHARETR